jgi:hypothetical protein
MCDDEFGRVLLDCSVFARESLDCLVGRHCGEMVLSVGMIVFSVEMVSLGGNDEGFAAQIWKRWLVVDALRGKKVTFWDGVKD